MRSRILLPYFSDDAIIEGTNKWINMVARYELCPFINSFGKKRSLVVERSLDPAILLQHSKRFMNDNTSNVLSIVLPCCPIPGLNDIDCSKIHPQMITSIVMSPILIHFRKILFENDLRRPDPSSPLIDVIFNPYFIYNANWAPWPVIQLVKGDVMEQAERSYKKSHNRDVDNIVFENAVKFPRADMKKIEVYWKEVGACYGGSVPKYYDSFFFGEKHP
jgi:hypothetical protein